MPELGTSGSVRGRDGQPPGLLDRVFTEKTRGTSPCGTNPTTTGLASSSCRFAELPDAHYCPWPAPPPDARATTGWLQREPPADLVRLEYHIAPLARLPYAGGGKRTKSPDPQS